MGREEEAAADPVEPAPAEGAASPSGGAAPLTSPASSEDVARSQDDASFEVVLELHWKFVHDPARHEDQDVPDADAGAGEDEGCGGSGSSSTTTTAAHSEAGDDARSQGSKCASPALTPQVSKSTSPALTPQVSPSMWIGLGMEKGPRAGRGEAEGQTLADADIVRALGASAQVERRLSEAADYAADVAIGMGIPFRHMVIYGSLSIARGNQAGAKSGQGQAPAPHYQASPSGQGPSCFVTNHSDIDFAILLEDDSSGSRAASSVDAFCRACKEMEWRKASATVVPRFAVSQWTLVSSSGVHLDLTIFNSAKHFRQFKERQRAFREIFWQTRQQMVTVFGPQAKVTFDAYVYLLKAFAAFLSRDGEPHEKKPLTSFQATCLGLFVLQRTLLHKSCPDGQPAKLPSALSLFKRFIFFCEGFFADGERAPKAKDRTCLPWHRQCALGFADCARVLARVSPHALCELYFVAAEVRCDTPTWGWMNVLHSVDPKAVHAGAKTAVDRWFGGGGKGSRTVWNKLSSDVLPVMKMRATEARQRCQAAAPPAAESRGSLQTAAA